MLLLLKVLGIMLRPLYNRLTLQQERDEKSEECADQDREDENISEVARCKDDLLLKGSVVLTKFKHCFVHDNTDGVIENRLSEDDGEQIHISIHLFENSQDSNRVSCTD